MLYAGKVCTSRICVPRDKYNYFYSELFAIKKNIPRAKLNVLRRHSVLGHSALAASSFISINEIFNMCSSGACNSKLSRVVARAETPGLRGFSQDRRAGGMGKLIYYFSENDKELASTFSV